ncbi:hypothetical protein Agub_g9695, partial [Astrephomene gubernaculifera]
SIIYALSLALNGAGPSSNTHSEILRAITTASHLQPQQQQPQQQPQQQQLSEADLNSFLGTTMSLLNGQCPAALNPAAAAADGTGSQAAAGEAAAAGGEAGSSSSNSSGPGGSSELILANSIWTAPGTQLKSGYVEEMRTLYQATAREAAGGAGEVNAWVAGVTRGLIKQLIPNDNFDAILANAIYFKGLWASAFKPHLTQPGDFSTSRGTTARVSMMQQTFEPRHNIMSARKEGVYDAVSLPYRGGDFSAVALLPAPGVEVAAALREWAASGPQALKRVGQLRVVLPKFKVSSSMSVTPLLEQLGVQAAFGPAADFSRMTESRLHISDVVHKAVVEVDEEGTVAAAATAVIMLTSVPMPPPELVFNRPFAFMIYHNPTKLPIFTGVVNDPSAT